MDLEIKSYTGILKPAVFYDSINQAASHLYYVSHHQNFWIIETSQNVYKSCKMFDTGKCVWQFLLTFAFVVGYIEQRLSILHDIIFIYEWTENHKFYTIVRMSNSWMVNIQQFVWCKTRQPNW